MGETGVSSGRASRCHGGALAHASHLPTGALMKRTIFAGATLFLSASVFPACGSKDPPAQQPLTGYPQGQYGYQDPNAPPGQYPQQQPPPGAVGAPPMGAPPPTGAPPPAGTPMPTAP